MLNITAATDVMICARVLSIFLLTPLPRLKVSAALLCSGVLICFLYANLCLTIGHIVARVIPIASKLKIVKRIKIMHNRTQVQTQ